MLRHQGLIHCLVKQCFNTCLYEVHQGALFDKYEGVGFLLAMIPGINGYVKCYSKSNEKNLDGCLLETEILQYACGIMSFRDELDVGITG